MKNDLILGWAFCTRRSPAVATAVAEDLRFIVTGKAIRPLIDCFSRCHYILKGKSEEQTSAPESEGSMLWACQVQAR